MKNANRNSPGADRPAPQVPLVAALAGGACFAAIGLLIFATLLGLLPGKAPATHAPPVILWLGGTIFFSAGLGMALYRFLPKPAAYCALISLCAFVATFNWIAFGPGERTFTKTTTTSTGAVSSTRKNTASETEGRVIFGLAAGIFDALILFGLYKSARTRMGGARPPSAPGRRGTGGKDDV